MSRIHPTQSECPADVVEGHNARRESDPGQLTRTSDHWTSAVRIKNQYRAVLFTSFYGYFLEEHADSGLPALTGFLGLVAMVGTFLCVAILTCFIAVNAQEINVGKANDPTGFFTYSANGMLRGSAIGFIFGTLSVFISVLLYASLTTLNIPSHRNDLLMHWVKQFYLHMILMLISICLSIIFLTLDMYFLAYMKYPDLLDPSSVDYTTYKFIGISLWIALFVIIVHVIYAHVRFSYRYREQADLTHESKKLSRKQEKAAKKAARLKKKQEIQVQSTSPAVV